MEMGPLFYGLCYIYKLLYSFQVNGLTYFKIGSKMMLNGLILNLKFL